jgi:subtilisin-like proprotein convertase family protein
MRSSTRLSSVFLATLCVGLCATSSFARQTIACGTGGSGGAIPQSGTGGAGAPLPTAPLIAGLNVTNAPANSVVTEVKLHGLTHTWVADLQFVLTDPAGNAYNVFYRPGFSCDYSGDYTIVAQCAGGLAYPGACTGTAIFPVGTYEQDYGTFVSGTGGVSNTSLSSVPAVNGAWTLTVYDWAGGDIGNLTSWDLCFGTAPVAIPGTPTQVTPANGATASSPVNLVWSAASCAATYSLDIDGVVTSGVAATNFSTPAAPGPHTWRVRGDSGANSGPWTGVWTFNVPPPPPPSTCVTGGPGGTIPTTGTGGGTTWPTAMPPNALTSALLVTVPAGSTKIVAVKMHGLTHTYVGDVHITLTDPAGGQHTIVHRPGFTGAGFGSFDDYSGDYSIYELAGSDLGVASPPGDYFQYFGTGAGMWPSGTNGILNTPMGMIPTTNGTYTLTFYDWAGGDTGALVSWDLCFDVQSGPAAYCTAGTSTNGCVPSISATAQPSATLANACNISIANLEGQKFGIVFYGVNNTGFSPTPWAAGSNSFLCVKGPTQRTGTQNSGGTINNCDGALNLDWNAYQTANPGSVGNPFAAGNHVYVQGWYRDPPAAKTTNLSNALDMTMTP